MKKFFFKSKKKGTQPSVSSSLQDLSHNNVPSPESNLQVPKRSDSRASSVSLNAISNIYAYPSIKEKNLKDIFKAVWTEDFVKTRNFIDKSKGKFKNIQDSGQRTPLHLACVKGNETIVQLLLCHSKDFDLNVNKQDADGATPLIKAFQNEKSRIVEMLLSYNPSLEVKDKEGFACIHYAARRRWKQGVKLLLDKGADVDIADTEGNTALHIASGNNDKATCSLLISQGATVDARNNAQKTPLIVAAENSSEEAVHCLVDGGHADLTLKDAEGWSAYDRAQILGFSSIQKYLRDKQRELQGRTASSGYADEEDEGDGEGAVSPVQVLRASDTFDTNENRDHVSGKEGNLAEGLADEKDNVVELRGNLESESPTKSIGGAGTQGSWDASDSESLPVVKPSPVRKSPGQETQTEKDRETNQRASNEKQMSDRFGSFDDDDESLSLNFDTNKKMKSKPLLARSEKASEEEELGLHKVSGTDAGNEINASPVKPPTTVKNAIGRKLSDLIDDDSNWDDTEADVKNSQGVAQQSKPKNSGLKLLNGDTQNDDPHSFVDFDLSVNTENPTSKKEQQSSYWDSSEDEKEALTELQKQKEKEKNTSGAQGHLDQKLDEDLVDKVEEFDSDVEPQQPIERQSGKGEEKGEPGGSVMYGEGHDNWDSDVENDGEVPREIEVNVKVESPAFPHDESGKFIRPPSTSPFDSEEEEDEAEVVGKEAEMKKETDGLAVPANMYGIDSRNSSFYSTDSNQSEQENRKPVSVTNQGGYSATATKDAEFNVIGAKSAIMEDVPPRNSLETERSQRELEQNLSVGFEEEGIKGVQENGGEDCSESSEVDKTETISSWEVENKNRKLKTTGGAPTGMSESRDDKMHQLVEEDVLEADNTQNNVEAGVDVLGEDMPDMTGKRGLDASYAGGGTVSMHIPSGGGDRIPSTPFPSKIFDKPDLKMEPTELGASREGSDSVDLGSKVKVAIEITTPGDDYEAEHKAVDTFDDSDHDSQEDDDDYEPNSLSKGLVSPRLVDLKKNVSSPGGLIDLKNKFRDQSRELLEERETKKELERKSKAFETEIDSLSKKIQSMQKEKNASEEETLRLRNDLDKLKQQLQEEKENNVYSKQLLEQRQRRLDKLEADLDKETGLKVEAEKQCRLLQRLLNEANSKIKTADHIHFIQTRATSRNGSNSLPAPTNQLQDTSHDDTLANQLEDQLPDENNVTIGRERLDELTNQNSAMAKQIEDQKKTKDELTNQITRFELELRNLQGEKERMLENLEAEKKERKSLSKELELERAKGADRLLLEDKVLALKDQLAAKNAAVEKLQSELEAKTVQIEDLRSKLHQTELENTRLTSDLKHAEEFSLKERKKLEDRLEQLKNEKSELQTELKYQSESFTEKEKSSRGQSEKLASELNKSVFEYQRELAVAEARLKDNEEMKRMTESEVSSLRKELDAMRNQLETLLKKNADAEVRNSELSTKLHLFEQLKEKEPNFPEKITPKQDARLNSGPFEEVIEVDLGDKKYALESAPAQSAYQNWDGRKHSNLEQLVSTPNSQGALQAETPLSPPLLQGLENELELKKRKQSSSQNAFASNGVSTQFQRPSSYGNASAPQPHDNHWEALLDKYKKEIEAQCRQEFNEKMAQVKSHLDEQSSWLSNLEKDRSDKENMLKREYNRRISDLELEIRKYKELYGVTIPVRDHDFSTAASRASFSEDPELKRLHTLLEKERKQREKLENKLEKMVDRDIDARAHLLAERQRLGDVSFANSTLGGRHFTPSSSGYYHQMASKHPSYHSGAGPPHSHSLRASSEYDNVLERVKQKLDSSIARHLGTTKLELELFSQHPYSTWDKRSQTPTRQLASSTLK